MILRVDRLQTELPPPSDPDPVGAAAVQELLGGKYATEPRPAAGSAMATASKLSTFFELIQQDPIVSQVKLIAEPWDIGRAGHQVGNFPPQWTEWNGKYRDTVRDFWRGEPSTLVEFASRLTGFADLYESSARRPVASINFVTAHDGFTMRDLVSYNEKHNDANGEGNNDGESHNRSGNRGEEGDTDNDHVLTLRARQQRNFIATLLLSQGVPMLLHGDELGRTQQGNNNTYCQDSELSWIHWDAMDQPLVEFTAVVNKIRHDHPTFRRSRFFDGRPVVRGEGEKLPDIVWLKTDGTGMLPEDWAAASAGPSVCSTTATASRNRTPADAGSPTTLSCSASTPTTTTTTSPCRPRSTHGSGTCWWTPRTRRTLSRRESRVAC